MSIVGAVVVITDVVVAHAPAGLVGHGAAGARRAQKRRHPHLAPLAPGVRSTKLQPPHGQLGALRAAAVASL